MCSAWEEVDDPVASEQYGLIFTPPPKAVAVLPTLEGYHIDHHGARIPLVPPASDLDPG